MGNNSNDKDTSQPMAKDKYPAPKVFEAPEDIKKTLPTEEDLADLVPLFTWGELKEIVRECGPAIHRVSTPWLVMIHGGQDDTAIWLLPAASTLARMISG